MIFFPQTVTVFLDKEKVLDLNKASQQIQDMGTKRGYSSEPAAGTPAAKDASKDEDPMEAVKRAVEADKAKKP